MEFYRSEEYRELPDEFNRNIREEPVRESGKKKLLQLLISFAAVTLLIFPITITGHAESEPIIPDEPVITEPAVEEYEIVGKWQHDGQYYEFFEDGNAYWSNGGLFVLLKWQKMEDNNFSVKGEGIFSVFESSISYGAVDFTTSNNDGKVMMMQYGDRGGYAEFERAEFNLHTEDVVRLFYSEFSDRLIGKWWQGGQRHHEDEGYYVYISDLVFSESTVHVVISSYISDRQVEYDMPYVKDPSFPDTYMTIGDGTKMYIEEYPSANSTYSYETELLRVYHFITDKGESLLVEGINSNFFSKW